jgi:hypothetical protein
VLEGSIEKFPKFLSLQIEVVAMTGGGQRHRYSVTRQMIEKSLCT